MIHNMANLVEDLAPIAAKKEFPLRAGLIYLNHAGVAPIPKRTADVVADLARQMVVDGASRYPRLAVWQETARQRCGRLLGVAAPEIAFVANTSEGLSMVALGLDWRAGDEIVTTDQEFPANAVIWQDLARRFGLIVHQVPSAPDGRVDAAALLERVNPRTRLVTVSWVQFRTGAVVDLATLGAALGPTDTLLVVDAIQGLGALPLPVREWQVDAVVADGHKWLLAPEGCAIFHLSPKAFAQVMPRMVGWHSVSNAGDYDRIVLSWCEDMRRFEAGSPNLLGIAALGESVGLLLENDPMVIGERVRRLTGVLAMELQNLGCRLHTPLGADGAPGAGIVIASHPRVASDRLYQELTAAGLFVTRRGAGVRFAPHFYQDWEEIRQTLGAVAKVIDLRGE